MSPDLSFQCRLLRHLLPFGVCYPLSLAEVASAQHGKQRVPSSFNAEQVRGVPATGSPLSVLTSDPPLRALSLHCLASAPCPYLEARAWPAFSSFALTQGPCSSLSILYTLVSPTHYRVHRVLHLTVHRPQRVLTATAGVLILACRTRGSRYWLLLLPRHPCSAPLSLL